MKNSTLHDTAKALVANGRGILAADESAPTCKKRFDAHHIPDTPEMQRKWRQLLLTTEGIEKGLSGVILYDGTIRQKTDEGIPFAEFLMKRGIIPGIKVDKGTVNLPGFPDEKVTEGLDGLRDRLAEYRQLGARFTKWRSVIRAGERLPSPECVDVNAWGMAQYAALAQEAQLVPIVEPEVLLEGAHTLPQCVAALHRALQTFFSVAGRLKVDMRGLLLKTSMSLPGKDSGERIMPEEVAKATLDTLLSAVPHDVSGIVFLSGGQTPQEATERLNAIARRAKEIAAPWPLTFSYSRALQEQTLEAWGGKEENREMAQKIFQKRVMETAAASLGEYKP